MIEIKRGDTFVVEATVTSGPTGVDPQDMTGWSVRAHLRRGNTLVCDLTVEWPDRVGGTYRLREDETTAWAPGTLTGDIEYTLSTGQIVSTETFEVDVLKDETRS